MVSVEVPTLWRPPGKPPTFGTAAPTHDCVSPGPTQNSVSSQRSSHQRHQTHDKGRGKSSLVACKWQVGRKPGPKPAPRVGPTPAPTASTPKRKTTATKDVPRPRPPPKPGAGPSPSIASRGVQALAAMAATSQNMNFVPRVFGGSAIREPGKPERPVRTPKHWTHCEAGSQTLQLWQQTQAEDLGLGLS